jgi:hypothetical protein
MEEAERRTLRSTPLAPTASMRESTSVDLPPFSFPPPPVVGPPSALRVARLVRSARSRGEGGKEGEMKLTLLIRLVLFLLVSGEWSENDRDWSTRCSFLPSLHSVIRPPTPAHPTLRRLSLASVALCCPFHLIQPSREDSVNAPAFPPAPFGNANPPPPPPFAAAHPG